MDSRITLKSGETFLEILTVAHQADEKVYLLVDDQGVSRLEGRIKNIINGLPVPLIEMTSGEKIRLDQIIAVNGVFGADYCEC